MKVWLPPFPVPIEIQFPRTWNSDWIDENEIPVDGVVTVLDPILRTRGTVVLALVTLSAPRPRVTMYRYLLDVGVCVTSKLNPFVAMVSESVQVPPLTDSKLVSAVKV